MRIGDVARILGVSRDTLRRLERQGVVAPGRDWNRHRRFTQADVERLRVVLFGTARAKKAKARRAEPGT